MRAPITRPALIPRDNDIVYVYKKDTSPLSEQFEKASPSFQKTGRILFSMFFQGNKFAIEFKHPHNEKVYLRIIPSENVKIVKRNKRQHQ